MNPAAANGISCDVARDLIPLCVDGAVSDMTRNYVKDHLYGCDSCRDFYRSVKSAARNSFKFSKIERLAVGGFANVADRIKRRRAIWTGTAIIALALSFGINLFIFLNWGAKKWENTKTTM